MEWIGIIGLFAAIAVLIVGSYKGLGALPLTLIAAFVAMITNGIPLWSGYATSYMAGYTGVYTSYFLISIFSALYAKLMEVSGCGAAIGNKLIGWIGKKYVLLICVLITTILTYGGVSLFVVIFALIPIMFTLFKEANLPRHLTIACPILGSSTYTMTALPGTPQLTNIIPTQYLGTTMTAAPVLSVIMSVALFAMGYLYILKQERKSLANGEVWTYPAGKSEADYGAADGEQLPAAWKAFAPIVLLLGIIIIGGIFVKNSALLSVVSMIAASVLCYALNYDKMKNTSVKYLLNDGLGGGIAAIGGIAAVVAFGTVVQQTQAYQNIVTWLMGLDFHPYVKGIMSTAVISGITGSSSGGLRLTLESLTDYFVSSGCNLDILHRLMAVAAGSLDTLPHSSGLFLTLPLLGLTHKDSYRHIFWISVVFPAIVAVVSMLACILFGL